MQEKVIQLDYGLVSYWINNSSKKDTILFIHGLTADHTLFDKQVDYFSELFNVIIIDASKHGKSRPFSAFSYSICADVVKMIALAEKIDKLILVGQSMGGYVAQMVICKYPNLVSKYISIDSTSFGLKYYNWLDRLILNIVEPISKLYSKKS